MHIADGLLPAPLCIGGYALGGLTLWWSLRQSRREGRSQWHQSVPGPQSLEMDPGPLDHHRNIARAALLTAAFFVASSVRIAIPPTSVHFMLVGLMGALLGSLAFPAVVVGLTLQAVLLGHGGLTALGLNAIILGWPALAAGFAFRACRSWARPWLGRSRSAIAGGFLAGCGSTGLAVVLFCGLLLFGITPDLNPDVERAAILTLAIAHGPLMVMEGGITAAAIGFFQRVYPQILPSLPVRSPQQ
ncbi:MAG: cobalt transporter CbiM [Cyanobacteria bacterium P01_H01_bin.130]